MVTFAISQMEKIIHVKSPCKHKNFFCFYVVLTNVQGFFTFIEQS